MILFKRRYCRRHGHRLNPYTGDFVLHCLRCGAMVDLCDFANKAAPAAAACTCHIFDIGPRCDFCVARCYAKGHPIGTHESESGHPDYCFCGAPDGRYDPPGPAA